MPESRRTVRAIQYCLLLLLGGCTVALPYVPNRPPVPLISHQGELNLSGGVHFPESSGFDYQAVYAPWDHISLFAGYQLDQGYEGSWGPPDTGEYNNRFFDIGIGFFDTINWAQYEAYFLVGAGTGSDRIVTGHNSLGYSPGSSFTDTVTLNVLRLGAQQNIGIEGSFGAFGIGLGVGYESIFNIDRAVTFYDKVRTPYGNITVPRESTRETSAQSAFYAEPIFFYRYGWKSVKIMGELWWSFRTNRYPVFGSANESMTLALDF